MFCKLQDASASFLISRRWGKPLPASAAGTLLLGGHPEALALVSLLPPATFVVPKRSSLRLAQASYYRRQSPTSLSCIKARRQCFCVARELDSHWRTRACSYGGCRSGQPCSAPSSRQHLNQCKPGLIAGHLPQSLARRPPPAHPVRCSPQGQVHDDQCNTIEPSSPSRGLWRVVASSLAVLIVFAQVDSIQIRQHAAAAVAGWEVTIGSPATGAGVLEANPGPEAGVTACPVEGQWGLFAAAQYGSQGHIAPAPQSQVPTVSLWTASGAPTVPPTVSATTVSVPAPFLSAPGASLILPGPVPATSPLSEYSPPTPASPAPAAQSPSVPMSAPSSPTSAPSPLVPEPAFAPVPPHSPPSTSPAPGPAPTPPSLTPPPPPPTPHLPGPSPPPTVPAIPPPTLKSTPPAAEDDSETLAILSDVSIHDIQGAAQQSPLAGESVKNVRGVVTAVVSKGFYLQVPDSDIDCLPGTSEGIFVFGGDIGSAPVEVGDVVSVAGTVRDVSTDPRQLPVTEIAESSVTVLSNGSPLPGPAVIGRGGRVPPSESRSGDPLRFDEDSDGVDFFESLEGMRVQVNDAVVIGPTNSRRQFVVVGDRGELATILTPRGGLVVRPGDNNPERILVGDITQRGVISPPVDVGDTFSSPIVGVLSYRDGHYMLLPTEPLVPTPGKLPKERASIPAANELTVATFNLENTSQRSSTAKLASHATTIVASLRSPDIIAIQEIQDNNGITNDGVVAANETWNKLVAAIVEAGGPAYQYRQIDPLNDRDGGQPGGNIRQGLLFNPARVSFVDRPGGTAEAGTSPLMDKGEVQLTYSPGRIDPTNTAFTRSRKPLVGEFVFRGHRVFVIVNHLVAKLGDDPLFGARQPPREGSEKKRVRQAEVVHKFVDEILSLDPTANVVVLGDMNDSHFSPSMTTMAGNSLTNLITLLLENERYTFVYEGNSQVLDNILVSSSLVPAVRGIDVVHVNAEYHEKARFTDHDPVLTRIAL